VRRRVNGGFLRVGSGGMEERDCGRRDDENGGGGGGLKRVETWSDAGTWARARGPQGLNHVKFDDRTVETDFESLENMVRV